MRFLPRGEKKERMNIKHFLMGKKSFLFFDPIEQPLMSSLTRSVWAKRIGNLEWSRREFNRLLSFHPNRFMYEAGFYKLDEKNIGFIRKIFEELGQQNQEHKFLFIDSRGKTFNLWKGSFVNFVEKYGKNGPLQELRTQLKRDLLWVAPDYWFDQISLRSTNAELRSYLKSMYASPFTRRPLSR